MLIFRDLKRSLKKLVMSLGPSVPYFWVSYLLKICSI